jgi:nitrogen regulatory protein P-II 1
MDLPLEKGSLEGTFLQVLFVVLNDTTLLDDVFSSFVRAGITGATCIESVGMGRALSEIDNSSIPIFAALRHHLNESRPYNRTIFALLPDEKVDEAIEAVEKVVGDLSRPGAGVLFTVPVGKVVGFPKRHSSLDELGK